MRTTLCDFLLVVITVALSCLVFSQKLRFYVRILGNRQTNRRTDRHKQMDSPTNASDRGKLATLIAADKRRRLLFAEDDDEVFLRRSFNVRRQRNRT